jgi:hypothetical protein
MKKVLAILALVAVSLSASAHGPGRAFGWHGGYYHGGYGCGGCWVAPAVVGGVIGYELARPYYVEPAPVVVQQPEVIVTPTVTQQPPLGYHWQEMIDPQTNQRKIVLVAN